MGILGARNQPIGADCFPAQRAGFWADRGFELRFAIAPASKSTARPHHHSPPPRPPPPVSTAKPIMLPGLGTPGSASTMCARSGALYIAPPRLLPPWTPLRTFCPPWIWLDDARPPSLTDVPLPARSADSNWSAAASTVHVPTRRHSACLRLVPMGTPASHGVVRLAQPCASLTRRQSASPGRSALRNPVQLCGCVGAFHRPFAKAPTST
jgi:hypothetical protein